MTKELQDLAWSVLPKEFKEEVKNFYAFTTKRHPDSELHIAEARNLSYFFGLHNLTSDAEGEEEMLYVSRKKVQEIYQDADNLRKDPAIPHHAVYWNAEVELLQDLFGSKCLPDEKESISGNCTLTDKENCRWKGKDNICNIIGGCYYKSHENMTEERYQYLNSLSLEDYDNETSEKEQTAFHDYQCKYHPNEVKYLQTFSDDEKPIEYKFKVGNMVKIKTNAEEYHQGYENGYCWLPERDKFLGKKVVITDIWKDGSIILNIAPSICWSPIDLELTHD